MNTEMENRKTEEAQYEAVIGLEIHAQMLTETKMFCGCPTRFGAGPNSQTCPVCIGMPGVLPVMNRMALEFAVRTGLATHCTISLYSRFARKNYFYPDLPKGYQISQYELPICEHGSVTVETEEGERLIGLTRIHMEEDAGKNIHEGSREYSFVDLNRAGVPLMEIVTDPDLRSPHEASVFMRKLRSILRYLDVCDGNMEQGSLRCDANVSLRPKGSRELGVKAEIKNMNSFKFVEKAIEYEIRRQGKILRSGGKIIQETRLWNSTTGTTESMRSKEEAHDYRYFPEPDLVPITIEEEWLTSIKASIPELQEEKKKRFIEEFQLPEQDAELLTSERPVAEWFEETLRLGSNPKVVSNWMMGELMRLLHEKGIPIEKSLLTPSLLHEMLNLIDEGVISGKIAKSVFEEMFHSGKSAGKIIEEKGLTQISDEGSLEGIVDDILAHNTNTVERYRGGESKLMGFFVGQVMKSTKGKANPKVVNELLTKKLQ